MTRQEMIDRLQVELTQAIDTVIQKMAEDDGDALGWVGDDLCRLMAKAATAVVEASIDVQAYMDREGYANA